MRERSFMLQIALTKARRMGVRLPRHARAMYLLFIRAFLAGTQLFQQKENFVEYLEQTKEGRWPQTP
jgi:hypothetical protein